MKNHFFLILTLCIGFFNPGFAQTTSDPLQNFYRRRDVAKMEQSLTTLGKSEFDADKKLFSGTFLIKEPPIIILSSIRQVFNVSPSHPLKVKPSKRLSSLEY